LKDFESGTKFSPVLIDSIPSDSNLEKILFVSGKLYYDLARELKARALEHRIALVRIEELCPFPFAQVRHALTQLARSTKPKLLWAQEEPRNQGPYSHVAPRFQAILDKLEWDGNVRLEYVGRKESEVPAVGVSKWHARELAELLERALAVAA
jgi:probable 2-oxoglutarate dehydrogenase E1 component DHKTD1